MSLALFDPWFLITTNFSTMDWIVHYADEYLFNNYYPESWSLLTRQSVGLFVVFVVGNFSQYFPKITMFLPDII
jgi:hypothetical protein